MADQLEVWENVSQGRVFVRKFDVRGHLGGELVGSGRKVHISTAERRINQEKAANSELDVFLNGTLQPIRVAAEVVNPEDAAPVTANHITDEDAKAMFKGTARSFEKRLSEISSVAVLDRILRLAEEVDATVRQVELIRARRAVVVPANATEVASAAEEPLRGGIKAVTPR